VLDHFFSVSGGGAAPIALCRFSAGVSANVGKESESGYNEVGCETFWAASGAIDGWEFGLKADV
jgi:hypothetical protein